MSKKIQKPKIGALTLSAEQLQAIYQQAGILYQTAWFIESAINTVLAETIGEDAPSTDGLSVYAETLLNFIKDYTGHQMQALDEIQDVIGNIPTVNLNSLGSRLAATVKKSTAEVLQA